MNGEEVPHFCQQMMCLEWDQASYLFEANGIKKPDVFLVPFRSPGAFDVEFFRQMGVEVIYADVAKPQAGKKAT